MTQHSIYCFSEHTVRAGQVVRDFTDYFDDETKEYSPDIDSFAIDDEEALKWCRCLLTEAKYQTPYYRHMRKCARNVLKYLGKNE